jgi:hypothetical protein
MTIELSDRQATGTGSRRTVLKETLTDAAADKCRGVLSTTSVPPETIHFDQFMKYILRVVCVRWYGSTFVCLLVAIVIALHFLS